MSSRGYWMIVSKARQTLVTEGLSKSCIEHGCAR